MKFSVGDDVIVEFGGRDHQGEVIQQSKDWILARILVDPAWDYGRVSANLDPQATVCVRVSAVRQADETTSL
jgi:hypothetical protein